MTKYDCFKGITLLTCCLMTCVCFGQETWNSIVYRELDLRTEENGGLTGYNCEEGITNSLFELVTSGKVKAYRFALHGNENFNERERVKPEDFLHTYNITVSGDSTSGFHVSCQDWPTESVEMYYVRERYAYQENNGSFKRMVEAICPVMMEDGNQEKRFPLFWVKLDDLIPYTEELCLTVSNSSLREMSLHDYLGRGLYQGRVYKVSNRRGNIIAPYSQDSTRLRKDIPLERILDDIKRMVYENDY